MNVRLGLAIAAFSALASVGLAADGPQAAPTPLRSARHPDYEDKGALSWSKRLADARAAARAESKLIFIEFGRPG